LKINDDQQLSSSMKHRVASSSYRGGATGNRSHHDTGKLSQSLINDSSQQFPMIEATLAPAMSQDLIHPPKH